MKRPASEPTKLRLLFIGNSFTNRNDVPGLVAWMAAASDPPVRIESEKVLAGGASLRQHWNAGTAPALIREQEWDAVVLQEQSTLPIKSRTRYHENVRLFHELIRERGTRMVLYQTWARQHARQTQQALNEAVESIAAETGATVVPAGAAWERALAAEGAPALYDADGSHPSPAGSYLAACAFYGTLLRRSPVGLPAPPSVRITDAQARALQEAAWEAVTAGRA